MTDESPSDETASSVRHPATNADLSRAVVEAVAEVRGIDPLDLDQRLFDVVDPDALAVLCDPQSERRLGEVVFELAGCLVEVGFDGEVRAREATPRRDWSSDRGQSPDGDRSLTDVRFPDGDRPSTGDGAPGSDGGSDADQSLDGDGGPDD